jgi:flagellar biosynthesis chaperone FliJ
MAVSRALRRLLRIRDLEEEQSRLALDSALGELRRLEHMLAATFERERRGRSLVQDSVQTGQLADRLAGIEETRAAGRYAAVLEPRIDAAGEQVTQLREEFLLKRVERRQAETLIQETEAREVIEVGRRGQQDLDNWHSSRLYRKGSSERSEAEPVLSASEETVFQSNVASPQATRK